MVLTHSSLAPHFLSRRSTLTFAAMAVIADRKGKARRSVKRIVMMMMLFNVDVFLSCRFSSFFKRGKEGRKEGREQSKEKVEIFLKNPK